MPTVASFGNTPTRSFGQRGRGKKLIQVFYLVISGGGVGDYTNANYGGGGGGAGGYIEGSISVFTDTNFLVTVGAGQPGYGLNNSLGSPSKLDFISTTVQPVGGAGSRGVTGGSGSGGTIQYQPNPNGSTPGQGFNGGSSTSGSSGAGGGGGGAGSVGGSASGPNGGVGGSGKTFTITGTPVTLAGGGGGGAPGTPGSASAGGGAGSSGTTNATNGAANTGGGGGGACNATEGQGGSGIVIISVPDSSSATFSAGVTQTSTLSGGRRIYTITAAGASDTVRFA